MFRAFLFFSGLLVLSFFILFFVPLDARIILALPNHQTGFDIPLLFFIVLLMIGCLVLYSPFSYFKQRRSPKIAFLKKLIKSVQPETIDDEAFYTTLLKHRSVRSFAYLRLFEMAVRKGDVKTALTFIDYLKAYPFYTEEKTRLLLLDGQIKKAYQTSPTFLPAILAYYSFDPHPDRVLLSAYLSNPAPEIADALQMTFASFAPRVQKKIIQKIKAQNAHDPLLSLLVIRKDSKNEFLTHKSSLID